MAKFYGFVGFGHETEVEPGVWDYEVVENPYMGDILRETLEVVGGQTVLGESKTANSFRIVADAYAKENFMDMIYVKWNGRYFEVKQVELDSSPRLKIRIGGVYNGPTYQAGAAPDTP